MLQDLILNTLTICNFASPLVTGICCAMLKTTDVWYLLIKHFLFKSATKFTHCVLVCASIFHDCTRANKMLYVCQWFLTLLIVYYVAIAPPRVSATPQQGDDKPVKYAPNYCLRFRFNCQRPEKKSHVCCLYPQNPNPSGGEERRPSPNYGTAVKFRPVKLPCVR